MLPRYPKKRAKILAFAAGLAIPSVAGAQTTTHHTVSPEVTPSSMGTSKIIDNGLDASGVLHFDVVFSPATCSPDGTIIAAPNGTLMSNAGKDTWTWGAKHGSSEYTVTLNGQPSVANGGWAVMMEVAHNCALYHKTAAGSWWQWDDASKSWKSATAP